MYDAENATSERSLPGKLVRDEGQKAVKDKAVNEAFDNVGSVLKFYKDKFQWTSIDNQNADVISSVHFGQEYENACKSHLLLFLWPRHDNVADKKSLGPHRSPDGLW